MVDAERKGQSLMTQADKKLRSVGGLFGSWVGGSEKIDEAAELYCKAANSFKVAKNWSAAGNAFLRAASQEIRCKEKHIAASHYADAGNCFRKVNPSEAVKWYIKAIDIYVDMGRFNMAARHHITVAEIYEAQPTGIHKAMEHYEQAADYYKGEESASSANKCLQKVAWFAAQQQQYVKAADIYEKLGTTSMNISLLRYGAKDHFFKASLCHLCADVHGATHLPNRYAALYPVFDSTREYALLQKLTRAFTEQSLEEFDEAVKEYESLTRLDNWHKTLVNKIRDQIDDSESGEYNLR